MPIHIGKKTRTIYHVDPRVSVMEKECKDVRLHIDNKTSIAEDSLHKVRQELTRIDQIDSCLRDHDSQLLDLLSNYKDLSNQYPKIISNMNDLNKYIYDVETYTDEIHNKITRLRIDHDKVEAALQVPKKDIVIPKVNLQPVYLMLVISVLSNVLLWFVK